MDLNDYDAMFGTRLAVFRVMFSKTDAICPQQTGLIEIRPDGFIVDIVAIMRNGGPDYRMDPTVASDDFTFRRRIEAESCRIDIDITAQRWGNGKWVPLAVPRARTPDANPPENPTVPKDYVPAARPPSELEALDRSMRARANAGSLLQGWTATDTSYVGFPRERDCFDAIAISQIDRSGVTLLFPAGLQGGINRFFIERVDVDADHSTLYLSRRSCRVGFTVSAAISREGTWVPLPIEPFTPSKKRTPDAEGR